MSLPDIQKWDINKLPHGSQRKRAQRQKEKKQRMAEMARPRNCIWNMLQPCDADYSAMKQADVIGCASAKANVGYG
jgi:hypothetical protein